MSPQPDYAALAELLKALGHPLRVRIVAVLAAGPEQVCALAQRLAARPSIVSQQLRILRMAGLVAVSRDNARAVYRLLDTRVVHILQCVGGRPSDAEPTSEARS